MRLWIWAIKEKKVTVQSEIQLNDINKYPYSRYILRCHRRISCPEKGLNSTGKNKTIFFFSRVWYRQSAADTSLAFRATQSGCWMNSKAFTISIQSRLSEFSRIMAAKKTQKYPYRLQIARLNFPWRGTKSDAKRKTESYVFIGFCSGISRSWEWKSATGRFAAGRFGCVLERFNFVCG